MTRRALNVVFRADASSVIGTGHVMRCLTLGRVLREHGAHVRFVCREHPGHLCEVIEDAGFYVARLPKAEGIIPHEPQAPVHAAWLGVSWEQDASETAAALGEKIDWLIVDHYAIDARWEKQIKPVTSKILVLDDLADRQHDCDVLLDQNFHQDVVGRYTGAAPDRATLLQGPLFALLGREYGELRRRVVPRSGNLGRLLVSFGGADNVGLTRKTVEALLSLNLAISVDVVLSRASADFVEIERLLRGQINIRLLDRVRSLAPYMLSADLAIGAGGATHWERMCLGLPALVITMAENQRGIARSLAEHGLICWVGDAVDIDTDRIRTSIENIVRDGISATWSERCMAVVDGFGAERVAAVLEAGPDMPLVVRHGELRDEDLLLEWANDPVTRANGYNPQPIERSEHVQWFRSRLRNPLGCRLFIVETTTGVPLGQVRFDKRESDWEISYGVAPAFRGRGVGGSMLGAALKEFGSGKDTVFGQVKPDNIASCRIFEKLGFAIRSKEPTRLVYEQRSQT